MRKLSGAARPEPRRDSHTHTLLLLRYQAHRPPLFVRITSGVPPVYVGGSRRHASSSFQRDQGNICVKFYVERWSCSQEAFHAVVCMLPTGRKPFRYCSGVFFAPSFHTTPSHPVQPSAHPPDPRSLRRRKRAEQLVEATSIEQAERGTVHK